MRDFMPVVFATDEAYVLPTCVAICSLLENTCLEHVDIYILVAVPLSAKDMECFEIIEHKYSKCKINFVIVGYNQFDSNKLTIDRISIATMYRLLLPRILPQVKKCLYLDSDILLESDIAEFQSISISNDCIAGVKDDELLPIESHMRAIDTQIMGRYVNAGVLLMNLDKIREKRLDEKMLEESIKKYPFQDQDIINIVLYPYIKLLPVKFNCFNRRNDKPVDIVVLHMSGGPDVQPWNNRRVKDAETWWNYAELFKNTGAYKNAIDSSKKYEQDSDLSYIYDRCEESRHIYIWGFTKQSCNLYRVLRKKGLTTECTFVDNRKEKQNYVYDGVLVVASENIDVTENTLIINAVQNRRKEINEQISKMSINPQNIIQYVEKTDFYYRTLDQKYMKEEIVEKVLLDYGIDLDLQPLREKYGN